MRENRLCRERLARLLAVLNRQGGSETLRHLWRQFGIYGWEVEQAAEMGWLRIETRKPPVGRPSRTAARLNNCQAAKPVPHRRHIPSCISCRHWMFALRSTCGHVREGARLGGFCLPPIVEAYLAVYPQANSRPGAVASCSRLLKHPNVRAARQWFYSRINCEVSRDEAMPRTAEGIWKRLHEVGSWRADHAPWRIRGNFNQTGD